MWEVPRQYLQQFFRSILPSNISKTGGQGELGHICRATCAQGSGSPPAVSPQAPTFSWCLLPLGLCTMVPSVQNALCRWLLTKFAGELLLILVGHPFCQEALPDLASLGKVLFFWFLPLGWPIKSGQSQPIQNISLSPMLLVLAFLRLRSSILTAHSLLALETVSSRRT